MTMDDACQGTERHKCDTIGPWDIPDHLEPPVRECRTHALCGGASPKEGRLVWKHHVRLFLAGDAVVLKHRWGSSCHVMQTAPWLASDGAVLVGSGEHVSTGDE